MTGGPFCRLPGSRASWPGQGLNSGKAGTAWSPPLASASEGGRDVEAEAAQARQSRRSRSARRSVFGAGREPPEACTHNLKRRMVRVISGRSRATHRTVGPARLRSCAAQETRVGEPKQEVAMAARGAHQHTRSRPASDGIIAISFACFGSQASYLSHTSSRMPSRPMMNGLPNDDGRPQ